MIGLWVVDAACAGSDPEAWFPDHGRRAEETVVRVCGGCPVRQECLEYALPRPELVGVWGGLTASQRDQARRRAARGQARVERVIDPRSCAWCEAVFVPPQPWSKYCSGSCRRAVYDARTGRRPTHRAPNR